MRAIAAAAARHADEAAAHEARLKAADTDAAARFAAFQRMLAGGEESASDSAAMSDTNSGSSGSSSLKGALEGEMTASDEEDGCLQFSAVEEAVWAAEARAEIEADEAGAAIEWA